MLASLVAQSGFAPGGNRSGTANRGFAFAAAVGMVVGVHDRAADGRSPAHVTFTTSFTDRDVFMVDVADLADAGDAVDVDVALFAGGKSDECVSAFFSHQLSHVASCTNQLSALTVVQLDAVDKGTNRDVCQRQSVAGFDVGVSAVSDDVANLQSIGSEDVSLLAIFELDQCDECAAVGIVFDGQNGSVHANFIAFEVDNAVFGSVSAAMMTNGDAAIVVTAGGLFHGLEKALLRSYLGKTGIIGDSHCTRARGDRLKCFDRHFISLSFWFSEEPLWFPIHHQGPTHRPLPFVTGYLTDSFLEGYQIMPSKNSMVLEFSVRVTIAFFQSGR